MCMDGSNYIVTKCTQLLCYINHKIIIALNTIEMIEEKKNLMIVNGLNRPNDISIIHQQVQDMVTFRHLVNHWRAASGYFCNMHICECIECLKTDQTAA